MTQQNTKENPQGTQQFGMSGQITGLKEEQVQDWLRSSRHLGNQAETKGEEVYVHKKVRMEQNGEADYQSPHRAETWREEQVT
jgi:hypothetical protein